MFDVILSENNNIDRPVRQSILRFESVPRGIQADGDFRNAITGAASKSSDGTRESILSKPKYNMLPVVHVKLLSRPFEHQVLKAIFNAENDNRSLLKLRKHPTTWGWASRWEIAHRMGFSVGTRADKHPISKSLSRKIRRAFLWLSEKGYLKYHDVNKPGMNPKNLEGATRFLLAFWMLKVVADAIAGTLLGLKATALMDTSRTPMEQVPYGGLYDRAGGLSIGVPGLA